MRLTIARTAMLAALLLVWELGTRAGLIDAYFVSRPTKIAATVGGWFVSGFIYPHVWATVHEGDPTLGLGEYSVAIEAWQRIETQNPAFLALVAERLADAYRKTGHATQGLRMLKSYLAQYPSLDLLNTVFTLELAEEGPVAASTLSS